MTNRIFYFLVAALFGLMALDDAGFAAPSPKPSPSPAQTPAAHNGTSALVVGDTGAETLLGLPVQTSKGEDLGHVVDVVVDRSGVLLAAIVDFGGFLGVGSRKIAVDWHILHFPKTDGMNKLIADLPLNQLREAPVYKSGEPIVIMGAAAPPAPVASPGPAASAPPQSSAPPQPSPAPSPSGSAAHKP
jgi:hypothetical protein